MALTALWHTIAQEYLLFPFPLFTTTTIYQTHTAISAFTPSIFSYSKQFTSRHYFLHVGLTILAYPMLLKQPRCPSQNKGLYTKAFYHTNSKTCAPVPNPACLVHRTQTRDTLMRRNTHFYYRSMMIRKSTNAHHFFWKLTRLSGFIAMIAS